MSDLLAGSEWWFLERLHYEGALLEVDIAEGIISAVSKNVLIDKGLSLKGCFVSMLIQLIWNMSSKTR